jgi:hypothetical protein
MEPGGSWWEILVGDLMEIDHLMDLRVDGRIILELIFKTWDEDAGTGLIWLRVGGRLL